MDESRSERNDRLQDEEEILSDRGKKPLLRDQMERKIKVSMDESKQTRRQVIQDRMKTILIGAKVP